MTYNPFAAGQAVGLMHSAMECLLAITTYRGFGLNESQRQKIKKAMAYIKEVDTDFGEVVEDAPKYED